METIDYHYQIYSPGGNETALFFSGIDEEAHIRKFLNDKILSEVEQVGFIGTNLAAPRLVMAGGEFCGNATRSAAWHYLKESVGEITISVSGISKPLKAGVRETDQGYEAWTQMPVHKSFDKIKVVDIGYYKVEMEGIIHLVVTEEKARSYLDHASKTDDFAGRLKKDAATLLKKYNLNNTAAGVMFLENTDKGIKIHPCVTIPGISSYYETACGSGTIAVGLVKCLLNGASVEIPLIQPSDQIIKAIIDFDGKEITNAVISGPIKTVTAECIQKVPKFEILQIKNTQDFNKLSEEEKTNAIKLYGECFKYFPYCENIPDEEIQCRFLEYCGDGILLFGVDPRSKYIMSFAAAIPLKKEKDVLKTIVRKKIEHDPAGDWYHAEIGSAVSYRRHGISHLLGRKLFELIPAERIFMRTHKNNEASRNLHKKMSFTVIENSSHRSPRRKKMCGKIESDKSILLVHNK